MDDDKDGQRIARYVMGECSPEERPEVRTWIEADEGRARLAAELEWVWDALGRHRRLSRVDLGWQKIMAARAARAPQVRARPEPLRFKRPFDHILPRRSPRRRWIQAAAALVVGAAGAALWHAPWYERAPQPPAEPAPMHEVATPRGQRARLDLADGTRVMLNADTRLRYPRTFGGSGRDVYLEGEAYFEVLHDSTRPFTVHTARGVARDLGTKFAVRAYADAPSVDVVVAEGVVALGPLSAGDSAPGPRTREVVLTAATVGSVDATGRISVRRGIDVADHLAWTEGHLVFAEAPLREVISRLSRWYDLDVRLADTTLADIPFTASLSRESPEGVLRLLAASVGARLERRGAAYVLYPREEP